MDDDCTFRAERPCRLSAAEIREAGAGPAQPGGMVAL